MPRMPARRWFRSLTGVAMGFPPVRSLVPDQSLAGPRTGLAARDAGSCRSRCAACRASRMKDTSAGACSRRSASRHQSSSSASSAVTPSCSTTTACTRSPHLASGRPMTATSLTFGQAPSTASTSDGIDVLAAGDDHVLLAVDQPDVAVAVAHAPCRRPCNSCRGTPPPSCPAASSSRRRSRDCRSRARPARRPAPRRRHRRAAGSAPSRRTPGRPCRDW